MTFGSRHYVPVLKVKRGEKHALAAISPGLRQYIVPLLEIVARKKAPTVDEHLSTSFTGLSSGLRGYPRCLLDVREIGPDGPSAGSRSVHPSVGRRYLVHASDWNIPNC